MPPTAEPRCRGSHRADQQVTWHYSGRANGLVGTGATAAERALGYGSAAVLTLAILCAQLVLPLGPGLDWVVPALFVKLVLAHAVREEPYAAPSQLALSSP